MIIDFQRLDADRECGGGRKFAAGLDDHQGRRMRYEVLKKLQLFSSKQQQFFNGDVRRPAFLLTWKLGFQNSFTPTLL